jgi:hypothetical protein
MARTGPPSWRRNPSQRVRRSSSLARSHCASSLRCPRHAIAHIGRESERDFDAESLLRVYLDVIPTSDVYVDEPWLLMRWDSEHQCVFAEWRGFATSADFQGALTTALDIVRERQAVNFVNDTRLLELISDEDQRWLRYTWTPLAATSGLRRVAVVIAPSGLSRMAIQTMFKGRRRSGLQSRTFDSLEDAMRWVVET